MPPTIRTYGEQNVKYSLSMQVRFENFKDKRSQFCSREKIAAIQILHDYGPSHNGCYPRERTTVKLGQALKFLIQSFKCVSIQML